MRCAPSMKGCVWRKVSEPGREAEPGDRQVQQAVRDAISMEIRSAMEITRG
ncbi:hypothetical protein GCM10011533_35220 [Streptosporangium jomthongense]|nr:hypothetical protein GCM10011533_35220 [Streptosporangium jomthongense]